MNRPARKNVPKVSIRIAGVRQQWLCKCGCGEDIRGQKITKDHQPPLAEREINADGTDFKPPQADPAYIDLYIFGHDNRKTFGPGGTSRIETRSGDLGRIQHNKRARMKHDRHNAIIAAKYGKIGP